MGRRKSRAISERENRSSAVIYVMSSGGDGTYFCCWMREKARLWTRRNGPGARLGSKETMDFVRPTAKLRRDNAENGKSRDELLP
jgi:hypothetical protein